MEFHKQIEDGEMDRPNVHLPEVHQNQIYQELMIQRFGITKNGSLKCVIIRVMASEKSLESQIVIVKL